MTAFDYISNISSNKMNWNLKVRVVRLWHVPDCDKPDNTVSLEIQDKKGDRIHATVGLSLIHMFKLKIKELDVIGEVVSYGKVESHNQGNKTSTFMNVELEDHERNNTLATFWGEFVDQILTHLEGSPHQPVIVVMQLIKAHKFKANILCVILGMPQSSGLTRIFLNASKLWINPDLPQVFDFKSRLASVNEANSFRISQIPSQRSYSVSDELATGIVEVKTITGLVDCMEKRRCLNGGLTTEAVPVVVRYKLQVQVMDRTGFTSLLLWDREATNLIGKSANELNESSIEIFGAVDECSYPVELYDILDKKILFKVTVKSFNIKVHAEVYNVVKINEDDNLIQQYSQSPQDDTFTDPDFECEQHTEKDTTFKDSMADNEMTSPAKTPAKRSREEDGSSVVDVGDDLAQFSSNKAPEVHPAADWMKPLVGRPTG
ncbi:PREDICTED: uncharacterized protein LOC109229910 [Nicotiana attenuata]|uniref:uncharacterized protein LOC109229910 n=1 Tax=Nicotiana attenuata TaxID=49451 RepID=UPI000904B9CA|nr:PREDICTED: uncharacterized protein LOC109229910 [Nicotiana attenuata]